MNRLKTYLMVGLMAVIAAPVAAQTSGEAETDSEIRANREYLSSPVDVPDNSGATDDAYVPIFIKLDDNHIIYNGADWGRLRQRLANTTETPVSILHIGDSHIQAEFSTSVTRRLLQRDFGNAGRGLVAPLKMNGTNQPRDYTFSSSGKWNANKLMSQTWTGTVGFTGCSVAPEVSDCSVTISTAVADGTNPFSSLMVFHSGEMRVDSVMGSDGSRLNFRAMPAKGFTQIQLVGQVDCVTICFNADPELTLFGAALSGDRAGLFYHAIGNNGATYSTYNRISGMGEGIAPLVPDLIIISLGTNEAFGRLNTDDLRFAIDQLVTDIRSANPDATLLLTTPMECQKSITRRKKGKKGTRRVKSFVVNSNIAPVRDVILDYGKENGIAVYDWYAVAGGAGASSSWIANDYFARDRVHHSRSGYDLEGRLLYQALTEAFNSTYPTNNDR